MKITIPKLSLVVLIGPSGSGKSTFARKHFLPTEVLSSDCCRGLVSDDENNQAATNDAFEVLHFIAAKRLALGRLTVVDATNVQPEARKPLVAAGPGVSLPAGGHRVQSAREGLPGAQPRPGRPQLRAARHPPAASQLAAVAPRPEARRLSARLRARDAGGGRGGDRSSGCRCGTTNGRTRAVRHHRRRAWLLR